MSDLHERAAGMLEDMAHRLQADVSPGSTSGVAYAAFSLAAELRAAPQAALAARGGDCDEPGCPGTYTHTAARGGDGFFGRAAARLQQKVNTQNAAMAAARELLDRVGDDVERGEWSVNASEIDAVRALLTGASGGEFCPRCGNEESPCACPVAASCDGDCEYARELRSRKTLAEMGMEPKGLRAAVEALLDAVDAQVGGRMSLAVRAGIANLRTALAVRGGEAGKPDGYLVRNSQGAVVGLSFYPDAPHGWPATPLHAAPVAPQAAGPLTADALAVAWAKYAALFGEPPHGTVPQCAALLDLLPKETT